jgi:hypothetical protein
VVPSLSVQPPTVSATTAMTATATAVDANLACRCAAADLIR